LRTAPAGPGGGTACHSVTAERPQRQGKLRGGSVSDAVSASEWSGLWKHRAVQLCDDAGRQRGFLDHSPGPQLLAEGLAAWHAAVRHRIAGLCGRDEYVVRRGDLAAYNGFARRGAPLQSVAVGLVP